jgi:hypothetical protein
MEIPTKEIIEGLDKLSSTLLGDPEQPVARIKTVLDAINVIKMQRQEIKELQLVIVRLRDEGQMWVV